MIHTVNLRKEFNEVVAVDNLSLTIPAGEIYGLIGPNGAGKTTVIRMLCGLLEPTQGDIQISGVDIRRETETARKQIGYLSDFFSIYEDLKVWEYLDYFAHAYKIQEEQIPSRITQVITEAGLEVKRDSLIHGLSRGMKQRLGIARAMIHRPAVLLLDEPASGLDPRARIELRNLLRSVRDSGATILISSHILTELEGLCTSIGIMEKGRLVRSGKIEEVVGAGPQRIIRLRWLGPELQALQGIFFETNAVAELKLGANEGQFRFSGSDDELAQLFEQAVNRGIRIVEFYEIKQTVEEVYMKISSHEVM
jgi:ABC-2 type transport system ATP-binding protein